jgi:hypothetical protein
MTMLPLSNGDGKCCKALNLLRTAEREQQIEDVVSGESIVFGNVHIHTKYANHTDK